MHTESIDKKLNKLDIQDNINVHRIIHLGMVANHTHEFLEVFYVVRGELYHTTNGITTVLKAGDFCIIDHDVAHSLDSYDKDVELINCLFKPNFIDSAMADCKSFNQVLNNYMVNIGYVINGDFEHIFKDRDAQVYNLLNKMIYEYNKKQIGYLQIIRSILIEIIVVAIREIEDRRINLNNAQDPLIIEVINLINENLAKVPSLTELAQKFSISTSGLSRRFKVSTNMGFSEYIQTQRLNQACRLLANTNQKIAQICFLCGYTDVKFFNEIFKKKTGKTPTQYRLDIEPHE